MGQANLPMLNRTGETIFWSANNENLINYMRCFTESFFLQKTIALLLHSKTSLLLFFFSNLNKVIFNSIKLENDSEKFNLFIFKKFFKKNRILKFNRSLKKFIRFFRYKHTFLTKVFLLSYYNWIIITIRVLKYYKKKSLVRYEPTLTIFFWKYLLYNFFYYNSELPFFFKKF